MGHNHRPIYNTGWKKLQVRVHILPSLRELHQRRTRHTKLPVLDHQSARNQSWMLAILHSSLETMSSSPTIAAAARTVSRAILMAETDGHESMNSEEGNNRRSRWIANMMWTQLQGRGLAHIALTDAQLFVTTYRI